MAVDVQTPAVAKPTAPSWLKSVIRKAVALVLVGLALGFAYKWAVPRLYRPESKAGFQLGAVHGALMPVALPSLLMGMDVPIYTENNSGRTYKIGYIAGINVCGLLFFGLAFRRPSRKKEENKSSPVEANQ